MHKRFSMSLVWLHGENSSPGFTIFCLLDPEFPRTCVELLVPPPPPPLSWNFPVAAAFLITHSSVWPDKVFLRKFSSRLQPYTPACTFLSYQLCDSPSVCFRAVQNSLNETEQNNNELKLFSLLVCLLPSTWNQTGYIKYEIVMKTTLFEQKWYSCLLRVAIFVLSCDIALRAYH